MNVFYDYLSAKFHRRLPFGFWIYTRKIDSTWSMGHGVDKNVELPTCKSAILAKAACFLSMILCFLKASLWYASAIQRIDGYITGSLCSSNYLERGCFPYPKFFVELRYLWTNAARRVLWDGMGFPLQWARLREVCGDLTRDYQPW